MSEKQKDPKDKATKEELLMTFSDAIEELKAIAKGELVEETSTWHNSEDEEITSASAERMGFLVEVIEWLKSAKETGT